MLDTLIGFLIWVKKSERFRMWGNRIFSLILILVTGSFIWEILRTIFWQCHSYGGYSYGVYRQSYWNCESLLPGDSFLEVVLGGALLVLLTGSLLYSAWKKFQSPNFSVLRSLTNTTFPFFVGIVVLSIYRELADRDFSGFPWYLFVLGGLYAFSPIVHFLKDYSSHEGLFKKILTCYSQSIMALIITLAIFVLSGGVLFIIIWIFLGDSWRDLMTFMNYFSIFLIFTWMMVSYGWNELEPIDERGRKQIRKGALGLTLLLMVLWGSPFIKEKFIKNQIQKANTILGEYGESPEGYNRAASVWGLKWAMKELYLENKLYQKDLYARIFDRSIESEIDTELDVNKYRTRNSNGTSMLARGENAKVELTLAKHESVIQTDIGAIETQVTYEFQNTDTQNQEVIFSIELPTSESVVTNLRLGLNLELTGTLAPRGAAERVYTDSLRRNTDPALLEQTGPTTYRLRVFPVPSLNDSRTQGRQRVQFSYITPITTSENIVVVPKTDILNLKLTNKSEIVTRVMEGTKALHQDSFKTSIIDDLLRGKVLSVKLEGTLKDSLGYCAINTYEGINIASLSGSGKNLTKNIVFLDISKSIGEEKSMKKRYQELIDTWKNNGVALDIYTFNTMVTAHGYDLSDIDFWGNTDMSVVISYIKNNTIENANIVILTDDDSYEKINTIDATIDYKKLKSNRISLIQIGDKIRTLKTEVTKSILVTEGDVLRLNPETPLSEAMRSIFSPKKTVTQCEPYSGTNTGSLIALEGGRDGKKVIGESIFGTGIIKTLVYPTYLYPGYSYTEEKQGNETRGTQMISDLNGNQRVLYYAYPDSLKGSKSQSGHIEVTESGYYFLSGSELIKSSGSSLFINKTVYKEFSGEMLLERIGNVAHVINQSMSLIALENDRQRSDLERYSNQDNKYDTTYQNFDSTQSSPVWNRREMIAVPASNRTMFDASSSMESIEIQSTPRRSSSNVMFGSTKSASMGIQGGSANSLSLQAGNITPLSEVTNFGGTRGSFFQFFGILLLIPIGIWYFIRKKKSKEETLGEPQEKKDA